MSYQKIVNLLLPIVTALVLAFGGFLYARTDANYTRIVALGDRVTRQETTLPDIQRRLDRIELKVDTLVERTTK